MNSKTSMSVFHILLQELHAILNGMPKGTADEVSPAAYLSWDSDLPPLFFNSNILGSKPLLKGEDLMKNQYGPPGADGVAVGGRPYFRGAAIVLRGIW